jgi:hypothetical protein
MRRNVRCRHVGHKRIEVAYIQRPSPSSKRRPHFETRTGLGENKNLGHGS